MAKANMKKKVWTASIVGALAVMIAAALWGVDGVLLTPNLFHLDVPVVVFLEHFVAFAFMAIMILAIFIFRPDLHKNDLGELRSLKGKDWLSFFWIALFGGAIGTMAIVKALFYVNFEHLSAVVILQKIQPLFAILLAIIILKERPKKEFYLWAAACLVGIYLIVYGFHAPVFAGNSLLIGALLSLLAAFSFGSSTVFGKKVMQKVGFRVATYIRFGLTSVLMILIIGILSILFQANRFAGFYAVSMKEASIILLIALTTGGLAIFIYYYGLKRVPASKATIYELAFPVTAVVLDFIVNGEVMSAGQWIGAVIIIGSIMRITRLRNEEAGTTA